MLFSENHHKILKAIAPGFSGTHALANEVNLPETLTAHFLEELSDYGFIRLIKSLNRGLEGIRLLTKGKAALDSPDYFLAKPMASDKGNNWYGDRIAGDKIGGDKVMGNKVQIGTVQGDAVAGNKIINSQNLTQAAQDIKSLLDQLAIDYPTEGDYVRAGRAIETIKNNPTLKQRLLNAAKESSTTAVEKAIEAVIDNPAVSIIIAGVKGFIEAEE